MPTAPAPPPVFDADALLALAQDPASAPAFSPLSDSPFLLVDAESRVDAGATATASIDAWLRALPAPSIAVGRTDTALAKRCDARVDSLDDAQALIATIRHAPRAAAAFAQLLRITEAMPVEDALVAESFAYATLQAGAEFKAWLAANRAATPATVRDDGPAVLIAREGDALRLTLNRPSNRNGMSVEMRDALCEALQLVLADSSIARVRLDANGKCFSTGGDLTEFGSAPDSATAHVVRSLALPGRLLHRVRERVTVEVHGACIGSGIEFPALASRIEARANAWFELPELKYGLIPGAGGCVGIARRIGRQRTAWMVLSGERIDARTALDWGLVDALVERA